MSWLGSRELPLGWDGFVSSWAFADDKYIELLFETPLLEGSKGGWSNLVPLI